MHLLNTGVQFSIEKYFRAVFDKLKKNRSRIFGGFGCFGGSGYPLGTFIVKNLVICHNSLLVSIPSLPIVHCCNIFGSFLINKKKSTLGFSGVSGVSAVSAAGGFTRTFIVTNIVIYQRPLRISNLTHPTLHGGHCRLPAQALGTETAETPETAENPRSIFFNLSKPTRKYFSIEN